MFHPVSGSVEVICGPMFSGKTEELIRRVRRAEIARMRVQIFKPSIDTRYDEDAVVSHSSIKIPSQKIESSDEILSILNDFTRVVAIDEIQFFDEGIVSVVSKLSRRGLRVICAGLDLDYRGVPFGPMPTLLALADEVLKIHAICTVCGKPASKTYRKPQAGRDKVLLGETDLYEARCTGHWEFDEFNSPLTVSSSEAKQEPGFIN